jgi:hypothetical protein
VIHWKLQYYQELENKGPAEYDNIAAKEHAAFWGRMGDLLKKSSDVSIRE